ncbi:hypothetical protein [Candidatus Bathycorpusculum sp.]|uniref:hypothetical protein n=1 Tax=Candidatus Bathycorpusculum sp. TaxID=2994959 RepID=UPI0028311159|nr:hypothetical protein [Candidatus Termitimicrobium sp.]
MYDGYVFFCNKSSQQQCLSTKRFAVCIDKQATPSNPIKEGSVIFLYNSSDNQLVGPFTALSEGAKELDAGAWAMDVTSHIPSEDLSVTWEDLHILHNAREKLPFLGDPTICSLSTNQTQSILDLLRQSELYLHTKTP